MVITASNPVRASVSDTVLVTVFAVNDPPVVGSIETIYVTEDVPLEMWTMASLHELGIISDVDNTLKNLSLHYIMITACFTLSGVTMLRMFQCFIHMRTSMVLLWRPCVFMMEIMKSVQILR